MNSGLVLYCVLHNDCDLPATHSGSALTSYSTSHFTFFNEIDIYFSPHSSSTVVQMSDRQAIEKLSDQSNVVLS